MSSRLFNCIECNKDFYRFVEEGYPNPKFCSTDCKVTAASKHPVTSKVWRNCQACSKQFECEEHDKMQFCSQSCKEMLKNAELTSAQKLPHGRRTDAFTCEVCQKNFVRHVSKGYPLPKYCSKSCFNQRSNRPVYFEKSNHTCVKCGLAFKRNVAKGTPMPKHCSEACRYNDTKSAAALHSTHKPFTAATCLRCKNTMPENAPTKYFCSTTCKPSTTQGVQQTIMPKPETKPQQTTQQPYTINYATHQDLLNKTVSIKNAEIARLTQLLNERSKPVERKPINWKPLLNVLWYTFPTLVSLSTATYIFLKG